MKKIIAFFAFSLLVFNANAQDDPKTMHETAQAFMRSGDFNNSIIVLSKALEKDPNNLEMQKDLVMSYYLKRDYVKALDALKPLMSRDDADVVSYQIAGNVYKALEEPKECEKIYKKGLKKFPNSGPLHSEYGELMWESKNYAAIDEWEKGIQLDPGYSGNYYNAALYYFFTKDKVWSLVYAEIFVNMESLGERGAAMKQMLLDGYKEKLFSPTLKTDDKSTSEFSKAFLSTIDKQSSLADRGITTDVLTMIRTRFILDWYQNYSGKFPFKLFDYQQQLIREGMFEAYNQWLFGTSENLPAYDNWTKTHADEYNKFTSFQKTRVFRMPAGQYYSGK